MSFVTSSSLAAYISVPIPLQSLYDISLPAPVSSVEEADVLELEVDIFESCVPILGVEDKITSPADVVGWSTVFCMRQIRAHRGPGSQAKIGSPQIHADGGVQHSSAV